MKKVLSIILSVVMLLGTLSTLSAMPVFAESTGSGSTPKVLVPEKPTVGDGTQANPYEISKPEHFYWIQQNTNDAEKATASTVYSDEKWGPSFGGVYFKQTADLDFAGYVFKESMPSAHDGGATCKYDEAATSTVDYMRPIGHYTTDTRVYTDSSKPGDHMWGGFAGNYDGQGFAIKNLKISAHGGGTNERWTLGLFGTIYGATLKNMVLDNVDVKVYNHNLSGILVGKAYAPVYNNLTDKTLLDDAKKFDFNLIENIFITDLSSIVVTGPLSSGKTTASTDAGHYVGSIAGYALGTTIKNCINNASINAGYACVGVGGIVGVVGNSVLVDGCINNGPMFFSNLEGATAKSGNNKAFGGIVGYIVATGNKVSNNLKDLGNVTDLEYVAKTGLTIQNCINSGKFFYNETTAVDVEYWGGILGGADNIQYLGSDSQYKYLIKNCHNLVAPDLTKIQRAAGIIGCIFLTDGNEQEPLYVENCFSVDVGEKINYAATNEVHACLNRLTKAGKHPVILSGVNNYKTDGSVVLTDGVKLNPTNAGSTKATLAYGDKIWVENNGTITQSDKTFAQLVAEMTQNTIAATSGVTDVAARKAEAVANAAKTSDHTPEQLANAPEGSGTKADPYRIDSYEDLLWIAEGIKDGHDDLQYGIWATEGVGASYVGVYFEQTADIDLGGKTLPSIGGYYRNTAYDTELLKNDGKEYMSAFGGTYNGNGFVIKNGKIANHADATALSQDWAAGLFGSLYGGAVKKVTLSNIDYVYTSGLVFGGVVGQTNSPTGDKNFNVIENCVVTGTTTIDPDTVVEKAADNNWRDAGVLGGIVGRAIGATITGCRVGKNVVIEAEKGIISTGGIAGQIASVQIINCANNGTIAIVLDQAVTATATNVGYGGIAGHLLGYSNGYGAARYSDMLDGGLLIQDCYFDGSITDEDNVTVCSDIIHVGGILAGLNTPVFTSSTTPDNKPYLIINSHNLSKFTDNISHVNGNNMRKGGIVGSAWSGENYATLNVENCYSVDIVGTAYYGTNEGRWQNRASATQKEDTYKQPLTLWGDNRILTDGTAIATNASPSGEASTLATKSADEIRVVTDRIDAAITKAHNDAIAMHVVGSQGNNYSDSAYRILYGVNSIAAYDFVGVDVTYGEQTIEIKSNKLYTSVLANEDVVTAESLGYNFMNVLTIDVATLKPGDYTITPFVIKNGAENKITGEVVIMTVTAEHTATFALAK